MTGTGFPNSRFWDVLNAAGLLFLISKGTTISYEVVHFAVLPISFGNMSFFVLAGLLVLNAVRLKSRMDVRQQTLTFRMIVFMVLPYFFFLASEAVNSIFTADGQQAVLEEIFLSALFFLFLSMLLFQYADMKGALTGILKPYVYLSIYISCAGIAAFVLYFFVDHSAWYLPDGLMKKDLTEAFWAERFYTMPLRLGLVAIGGGDLPISILNFILPRSSGLSMEPHIAGFLVSPALFLVGFVFNGAWSKRRIAVFSGIILLFLLSCFSLTAIAIIALAASLNQIRKVFAPQDSSAWKGALKTIGAISILIIILGISSLLIFANETFVYKMEFEDSSSAYHMTYLENLDRSTWFGPSVWGPTAAGMWSEEVRGFLPQTAMYLQFLFYFLGGLVLLFKGGRCRALGAAFIYIVLHMQKDPGHMILYPFYDYFIFLFAFGAAASLYERSKARRAEPA